MDPTECKIVVVGGGGTLGSSAALHLLRRGFRADNITVLDPYPIPSSQSAGNDLNKIMGIALRNPVDYQLSLAAQDMWMHDPLFRHHFHQTGRLDCASNEAEIAQLKNKYQALVDAGLGDSHEWLDDADAILAKAPLLEREKLIAIWDKNGGWVAASQSIRAVGAELARAGVKFAFGDGGRFKTPILDASNVCVGVETADGTRYYADKVVLATGAWTPALLDLEGQCCSKAWVVAHMQLSPEEAAEYRECPVVYNAAYGFFFEPNEHGVVKVCDEFPGFTRFKMHTPWGAAGPSQVSVPRSHSAHPTDTIPYASDRSIARAIDVFLPCFRNKPLFDRKMCWCTDTADANLLICEHPRWKNLIVASGDSGHVLFQLIKLTPRHSFKLHPIIGKHIVDLLEGRLAPELAHAWRWRPGLGDPIKSVRPGYPRDLADMPGWRHDVHNKL